LCGKASIPFSSDFGCPDVSEKAKRAARFQWSHKEIKAPVKGSSLTKCKSVQETAHPGEIIA